MAKHKKKAAAKKALPSKMSVAEKIAARSALVAAKSTKKHGKHRKWVPLNKLDTNRIHGALYRAWRGYTIARGMKDEKKMKYYAEGIDKLKQELAKRGVKDKHSKSLARKALGPTKKQGLPPEFPKYADGLMLPPLKKGGPKRIISPFQWAL